MLVLSRQKDESIMIGDDVEIIIVDVRGNKVRLGITAPKEIPVHRMEIYEAIQREKAMEKESAQKPEKAKPEKTDKAAQEKAEKVAQEEPEKVTQEEPEKVTQKHK